MGSNAGEWERRDLPTEEGEEDYLLMQDLRREWQARSQEDRDIEAGLDVGVKPL